jgi:hypothetical protein
MKSTAFNRKGREESREVRKEQRYTKAEEQSISRSDCGFSLPLFAPCLGELCG